MKKGFGRNTKQPMSKSRVYLQLPFAEEVLRSFPGSFLFALCEPLFHLYLKKYYEAVEMLRTK